MRPLVPIGIALIAIAAARTARVAASEQRAETIQEEPYAPSAAAAPILSLGYRELVADLLVVRLTGYYGGQDSTAAGVSALVEAIVALDPSLYRTYEYGARAMSMAAHDVNQSTYLRAIAVLERGMVQFPEDWRVPYLAGQIYTQDLVTKDPRQRRTWDEKGTLLVESAIRKPGAPAQSAEWAAVMRTKLGQHERAAEGLREMLLVTGDLKARKQLIDRLAKLENVDADELAAEMAESRHKFVDAWLRDRPTLPPSIYILLGPRIGTTGARDASPLGPARRNDPGFDLGDLATGGRDLIGSTEIQKLEPLD